MAMPRGWRSSEPSPKPMAKGKAPNIAASVVIMIGRKRREQAAKMASRAGTPSRRSASSAKSIIMIAFFFTIPMSSNTPMSAMMLNSMPKAIRAMRAPIPAEGSVERIVMGWIQLS